MCKIACVTVAACAVLLTSCNPASLGGGGGGTPDTVATPTFAPRAGSYPAAQNVSISSTNGATIRYTIDGSNPSETAGTVYSGSAVSITSNLTLKAIAYKSGMTDSAVASAEYSFVPPGSPTISSALGGSGQVTVTWAAVSGATSYNLYWAAGTNVSVGNGTKVTGAVSPQVVSSLTPGSTYAFVATAVGAYGESSASPVVTAVATPQVVMPTFSPDGGSYTSAQSVTISCSTGGATIRYTVDGSPPSETNGIVGTSVNISSNLTLKAIGYKSGLVDSQVASATYRLVPPGQPSITAAAGGGQVTISWGAVSGATSYNLYWQQGSTVSTSSYGTKQEGVTFPVVVSGLTSGVQYAFVATAVGYYGEGAASNVATATVLTTWTDQSAAGSRWWWSIASSFDGTHITACAYQGDIWTGVYSGGSYGWADRSSAGSRQWSSIASSSDGSHLAAVVPNLGIYASTNYGGTWGQLSVNPGIEVEWASIASSSDGSHLAVCAWYGNNGTGEIWTGVYKAGTGWVWTEESSAGYSGWSCIASCSDGSHLAACNQSGNGHIYISTNYGYSWTDQGYGSGRPGSQQWTSIAMSSDGSHLAACGKSGYIYTTTDGGTTWACQDSLGVQQWTSVAMSSDGSRIAACCGDIYTSTDAGTTWTDQCSAGGPHGCSAVACSSDGSHLAACSMSGDIFMGQ
jgi:Chitobiase/beta-hexosaminidase C-terminal domain